MYICYTGDAIAFMKKAGKPVVYINDFPPEVEDILNTKFKDRILWLIKECLKVEPELRITYDKLSQVSANNIATVFTLFGAIF